MLQGLCVPSSPPAPRATFPPSPPFFDSGRVGVNERRLTDLLHVVLCLDRINEDIIVRLKWGQTEYKGRLISVDSYMNLQLSNTEEFIDGKCTGSLGQVLIR